MRDVLDVDDTRQRLLNPAYPIKEISERWAIIVGANEFPSAPGLATLNCPTKDANDMDDTLSQLGYVVCCLLHLRCLNPLRRFRIHEKLVNDNAKKDVIKVWIGNSLISPC